MKKRRAISLILAALLGMAFTVPAFAYSFSDIEGYWGADFVETAYEKGVVKGYNDGSFRPGQQVSYQEAATMICNTVINSGYKALNIAVQGKYSEDLKTLGVDAEWARAYVSAILGEGAAVSDFRDGSAQGSAVTPAQRQVIGSWAVRMLDIPLSPLCDLSAFADASSIDPAYVGEVDALVRCGIMSGYKDGTYRPDNIVTRGEFATVCVNMFDTAAALQEKEGNCILEESLFVRTGSVQGLDADSRSLTFSFGGTYTVPEGIAIIADGKSVEFKDLSSYAGRSLVVSYIKDHESALIIQTAPLVEAGKVKSISTEDDFWIIGILTGSGLTVNYILPMDSELKLPAVGTRVSFIAEGARIIEMQ